MGLYHVYAFTDVGNVRGNNEDNFYCNGTYKKDTKENYLLFEGDIEDASSVVLAVFDGMGGSQLGEEAALAAVTKLSECAQQDEVFDTEAVIKEMNYAVCQRMRTVAKSMGSTVVLFYSKEHMVQMANLGDSRGYLFRDGELMQLTEDHTEANSFLKMQRKLGIEVASSLHAMENVLTQYLGVEEEDFVIEPEISKDIIVKPNDIFLLCSDGLSGMLSEEELIDILNKELTLQDKGEKLRNAALQAGGVDNITVVLIEA